MPSSKLSRAAPPRRFENYVFTKVVSSNVGLFPIASTAMTQAPGPGGASGALGASNTSIIPIGFDFNFDGRPYKNFVANPSGWMALVDPAFGSFSTGHVMTVGYINDSILNSFSLNHVLLCPWFDDLRNMFNNLATVGATFGVPVLQDQIRINHGLDVPPVQYNPVEYGIKYANTTDASGRRCLIVRWFSLSGNAAAPTASVLKFDVVLYENGTIEYRYTPRTGIKLSDPIYESATVGIFLNNDPSVNWRFRDMSVGLGYRDGERQNYKYGGSEYTATYSDNSIAGAVYDPVPFTVNLQPSTHWPGLNSEGCVMTLQPPVQRRKILARSELRSRDSKISMPLHARTGDVDRLGTRLSTFDDRRSINFVSGTVVNYPTTIPRFYAGSEDGIVDRQDLFAGDFELTASIVQNLIDDFVGNVPTTYVTPFSEHNRPDQNNEVNDFFSVGSNIDQFGDGLSQPLRDKTQIRLEFPVNFPTQMFDVTSSIYHYNKTSRGFFVPQQAKKDLMDPLSSIQTISFFEDARGFGALGNVISSGSAPGTPTGPQWQSDPGIGQKQPFKTSVMSTLLTRYFSKSVQNNPEYIAASDEQFELPINHPFLIEKVVFEIPFTMGDGWFQDRTTTGIPFAYTGGAGVGAGFVGASSGLVLDTAGPAITVSLFNQVAAGPNTYRDLILTGSIIPIGDNYGNIKASVTTTTAPGSILWVFSPEGFVSYGSTPAAVVAPGIGTNFTGSVTVPCVAGVSNGVTVGLFASMASNNIENNRLQAIQLLNQKYIRIEDIPISVGGIIIRNFVKDIDTFGRSAKSFNPSGRSVFGKEFVTTQKVQKDGTFASPLFASSSFDSFPANLKAALNDPVFRALAVSAIPVSAQYPSPYLVMPGDKLTLAISKMRPTVYSNGSDPFTNAVLDHFTASLRHNVTLATGSIKMTLYGSMLIEDREYHDTLNQPLASDAIHELVGSNPPPTLDQYEVEYRDAYYGTSSDDYITGSLVTVFSAFGSKILIAGNRGRVFSKLQARSQDPPDSNPAGAEVKNNHSKAFRLQPWFERVGEQRVTSHVSSLERYYDSMMPALNDCLRASSGIGLFVEDLSTSTIDSTRVISNAAVGYVWFNYQLAYWNTLVPSVIPAYNGTWTWSYPFEPTYSAVPRLTSVEKSFVADSLYDLAGPTLSTLPQSVALTYIMPRFVGFVKDDLINLFPGSEPTFEVLSDVNLNSTSPLFLTSSASTVDTIKCMYGFGDANTCMIYGGAFTTKERLGWNHSPEFRNADNNVSDEFRYSVGPIIRGWRYGVSNGLPEFSKAYWRRGKYGQLRDMLEQRPYTKFFQPVDTPDGSAGVQNSPIHVTFIDNNGKLTDPINTWSQNLSTEATSSLPYFDGVARNRPLFTFVNKSIFVL